MERLKRLENELPLTNLSRGQPDEMCSRTNNEELAGEVFDLHGNLLIVC